MQPDLTLIYNSQAGNGWLGIGWDLSVGAIFRSTKHGIPTYDDARDTFLFELQGHSQELVQVGAGADSYGAYREYRAQLEAAFIRFRHYPSEKTWRAWTKDGKRHDFQGLATHTASGHYFYWGLSRVTDSNGNSMTLSYPSACSGFCAPPAPGAPAYAAGVGGGAGYLPIRIEYAGHPGPPALPPASTVEFEYEDRTDVLTSGRSGFEQKIAQRLKRIKVYAGGNLVRKYEITYLTNSAGSSLLAGIKEIGTNGGALPETAFTYEEPEIGWQEPTQDYNAPVGFVTRSNLWRSLNHGVEFVDVNGDGLTDMLQHWSEGSGAWLNDGDGGWNPSPGWTPPVPISLLRTDLDGYPPDHTVDGGVRFADMDGDGLVDILQGIDYAGGSNVRKAWRNTGNGWEAGPAEWNPRMSFVYVADYHTHLDQGVRLADVNGDGLTDMVQHLDNPGLNFKQAWLNTGQGWMQDDRWAPSVRLVDRVNEQTSVDEGVRLVDINGDGLADILQGENGFYTAYQAWLNTGQGWTQAPAAWNPPVAFVFRKDLSTSLDEGIQLADVNGDSLVDIVQHRSDPSGPVIRAWLNTGHGWTQDDRWAPPVRLVDGVNYETVVDEGVRLADVNGDGLVDEIQSEVGSIDAHQVRLHRTGGSPYLLTTIRNELGGTIMVHYDLHLQKDTRLPFPVSVVKSVTAADGLGSAVTVTYAYAGGLYDKDPWPEREFVGFKEVRATTDDDSGYTVTHFHQNEIQLGGVNLFKGLIYESARYHPNGRELAKTANGYSYATPFPGVYFPFLRQVDSDLDNTHTRTDYAYDGYGNLQQETHHGDVTVAGDEKTLVTGYAPNATDYLVGYPSLKRVLDAAGNAVSETWFTYDGQAAFSQPRVKGHLTRIENWLSGGNNPVITKAYDAYGNLTDEYNATWNATNGAEGNHAHTTYDDTSHQFPATVTQAAGTPLALTESFTYDPGTGQVLTHTDANNYTTRYRYDPFGRLEAVIGPHDTDAKPAVRCRYTLNPAPPHLMVSQQRVRHANDAAASSGIDETLDTHTFLDGLGRAVAVKSPAPDGKQIVSGAVTYNSRGLVDKTFVSYTEDFSASYTPPADSQPHASTLYDGVGRVTKVTNPDGAYVTRSYNGWTEKAQDENGHVKDFSKDAYGQITEVREHDGSDLYRTTYVYDPAGRLARITNAQREITTLSYDTLGRKIRLHDPQMGEWEYHYDANGNLIRQTDAKGHSITLTHDRLNRVASKAYPDGRSITYEYDQGVHAKGRLSKVTDLAGVHAFAYDNEGRLTEKTRTLDGRVYTTQTGYDALGRETSLAYPDGFAVTQAYSAGFLTFVAPAAGGAPYATFTYDTEAIGKPAHLDYGNGVKTNYGYAPNNFRLRTLQTLTSDNTPLQSVNYAYDNVGNITTINDVDPTQNQTFSYDDLDRLLSAEGPYGAMRYAYDRVGNLTSYPETGPLSFWSDEQGGLIPVEGALTTTPKGRIGEGFMFDGKSQAKISGSESLSPQRAFTIELWALPEALGGGHLISKQGVFGFPKLAPDGSVEATLTLSAGEKTVRIPDAARLNAWRHYVLTYDGAAIKIYVNGTLAKEASATGLLASTPEPVLVGSVGFVGRMDEMAIFSRALGAEEIRLRYQAVPQFPQNRPLTPACVSCERDVVQPDTLYTFKFLAWDLDGDDLRYRVRWGDGQTQETKPVASGTVVEATHAWEARGNYGITVQAIQSRDGVESPESPSLWIFVAPVINARLFGIPLIGAVAGRGTSPLHVIEQTAGESVVSRSDSTRHRAFLGYQGEISDTSLWWHVRLGQESPGGEEPRPPPAETVALSDFIDVEGADAQQIATIARGVRQYRGPEVTDANGNLRVAKGRWIAYDDENRPIKVVTADGALTEFAYDFEGARVKQTITQGSQTQTTRYIGDLYEETNGESTSYIYAGSQRVAMKTGGQVFYFHPDHLGSTNLLTDSAGAVVRTTTYTPFGNTAQTTGTRDDAHKFTGHRSDDSAGLIYMKARYYDPNLGRFLTADPLITDPYNPQHLNRYSYVENNPINYTDPTGHWRWHNGHFTWRGFNREINRWGKSFEHMGQRLGRWLDDNNVNVNAGISVSVGFDEGGQVIGGGGDFNGEVDVIEGERNAVFLVGVGTSKANAVAYGQGSTIVYSSRGLVLDTFEAVLMKVTHGRWDRATRVLADEIVRRYRSLKPGELLILRGYSRGALLISNALYLAQTSIADKSRVYVRVFGGASWTYPRGFHVSRHINPVDPVGNLFGGGSIIRGLFGLLFGWGQHSMNQYGW